MQRMRPGWGRGETWPRDFTSGLYRYRLVGEDSKELGNEHVGTDSNELGNEHVETVVFNFMTAAQNVNSLLVGLSWFEKVGCLFKKNEREWLGDWTPTWSISFP